jgi:hypothetical protein
MLSTGENTNNRMTRGSCNNMPPTSAHHYPTRLSMPATATTTSDTIGYRRPEIASQRYYEEQGYQPQMSPSKSNSKGVTFELRFTGSSSTRARLPLRVNINSHDTVDSIVGTVKNFYGLYDAQSVSFEDQNGNVIIAQYENFENNMVVYVQVETTSHYNTQSQWAQQSAPAQRFEQDGQMLPPQPAQVLNYGQPLPRMAPQAIRNQSLSPRFGTRSGSANQGRTRVSHKNRGSSFQAGLDELDHDANPSLSDSDCGAGSVTSSKKARSEQLASAEISVDNIVEGGRRVRAKFESSVRTIAILSHKIATNSCRNCLSLFHHKSLHPIQSRRYRHSGDPMAWKILPHFQDHNRRSSPTASPYNLQRASHSGNLLRHTFAHLLGAHSSLFPRMHTAIN